MLLQALRAEGGLSGSDEEILAQIRSGSGPAYEVWREQFQRLVAEFHQASAAANPLGEDLTEEIKAARAEARAERRKRRAGSR